MHGPILNDKSKMCPLALPFLRNVPNSSGIFKRKMTFLVSRGLSSGFAAGDVDDCAVNVAGAVGGEEAYRVGDFAELAASS